MGWAYYEVNGKPCGYSVEATCEEPGCTNKINRGLAYLCGRTPGGGDDGCGGYFCPTHLFCGDEAMQCRRCLKVTDEEGDDGPLP
jgi:hypothetical protein